MNLEIFQLPLLPLVVIHAIHALRKDLTERPRFAGDPHAGRARLYAQLLIGFWFATNLSPVGYYVLECLRHYQDLFAAV